jgi:hypothetical protein
MPPIMYLIPAALLIAGWKVFINLRCDVPPIDLAVDVYLKVGDREWKADSPVFFSGGLHSSPCQCVFTGTAELVGKPFAIVLRPNIAFARLHVPMTRVLDHVFMLSPTSIKNAKS